MFNDIQRRDLIGYALLWVARRFLYGACGAYIIVIISGILYALMHLL